MPTSDMNIFVISVITLLSFLSSLIGVQARKKIEFALWMSLTTYIYYQSKSSGFDHLLFIFISFFGLRYFFNDQSSSGTFLQLVLHQVLIFFVTTTTNPIELAIFLLVSDIAFIFASRIKNQSIPFRLLIDLLLMIGVVGSYYNKQGVVLIKADYLTSILPVGLAISNIFIRFIKIEDNFLKDKTVSIFNVILTSLISYKIFIKLLDDVPQVLDNEVNVLVGFLGIVLVIIQFANVLNMKYQTSEVATFKYLSRIPFLGIIVISLSANIEAIDTFYPLLFCPLFFYQMFEGRDVSDDSTKVMSHLNFLTICFFLATPLSPYFWSQISMYKGLWTVGQSGNLVFIAIVHFICEIYFFTRIFIHQNSLKSAIDRINFDLFTRLVIIGVISFTFIIKK